MLIPVVETKLIKRYDLEIDKFIIEDKKDCFTIFRSLIGDSTVEKLAMICLDCEFKVINSAIVSVGLINIVEVIPNEILRVAILSNAHSIVICHNHVAGSIEPSEYDISITKKIGYVAKLLGIRLIDSLIIGEADMSLSIRDYIQKIGDKNE